MSRPAAASPSRHAPLLAVEGLVKRYRRRGQVEPLVAVDGVSFDVAPGEIVGLLGPNGAGKTTTIKLVCGLILADAGSVRVDGLELRRNRAACLRRIAAVLEGNRNLYWRLTALENLLYFAGNRDLGGKAVKREALELLERFGLAHKRDELVNELSRGMQQKLAIAVAMLANTDLLLLDEPTLGLDVEAGYEIRNLLKEVAATGRTVIISSHDMPVVQELCSRAVIIDAGKVIADERVDALLRLFETRAYSVTLGAPLPAPQRRELLDLFPMLRVEDGGRSVHVDLERGDDLYRLMAVLQEGNAPIEALDRTTVNFEQVFRRLVRGAGRVNGSTAQGPAAPTVDATAEQREVGRVP